MQKHPSIKETAFNCPHCGAYTTQYWHRACAIELGDNIRPHPMGKIEASERFNSLYKEKNTNTDEANKFLKLTQRVGAGEVFFAGEKEWGDMLFNLHLSKCYNCKQISIWRAEELIYPAYKLEVQAHASMPEDIKGDFIEASQICSISSRGSAALARLCIQKFCKHLGASGDNINDDIGFLVKNKGLNAKYQKMLDSARIIGNESVHPGEMDLKDDHETAAMLLNIINLLVEDFIAQPQKLDALYQRLPKNKKEAIVKRDSI